MELLKAKKCKHCGIHNAVLDKEQSQPPEKVITDIKLPSSSLKMSINWKHFHKNYILSLVHIHGLGLKEFSELWIYKNEEDFLKTHFFIVGGK